jgi:hypothetical protein
MVLFLEASPREANAARTAPLRQKPRPRPPKTPRGGLSRGCVRANVGRMKLGFEENQKSYISSSQSARAWTERWVETWVYCSNCGSSKIQAFPNNSPVADFLCAACNDEYELKSQKSAFGSKVLDGSFRTKCERLAASNNPNLFLLNYDLKELRVTNLLVVPKHFFARRIIEERRPLGPNARRAGWIGSNILLSQIPESGKIFIVRAGQPEPIDAVLAKWQRTIFLRDQRPEARGWLIEVMKCVEAVGRQEFELNDVYAFENRLSRLYPDNQNVRPKIRQQLQFLRDRGYLEFVSKAHYRLRS